MNDFGLDTFDVRQALRHSFGENAGSDDPLDVGLLEDARLCAERSNMKTVEKREAAER